MLREIRPPPPGGIGCAEKEAKDGKRDDAGNPASKASSTKAAAWDRPPEGEAKPRADGPHASPAGFQSGKNLAGNGPCISVSELAMA